jgi:hypothetical protein
MGMDCFAAEANRVASAYKQRTERNPARVHWGPSHTHFIEPCTKEQVVGSGWLETRDLVYREFIRPQAMGGCGGDWVELYRRVDRIEEPDYSCMGLLWRQLHRKEPRYEEAELEGSNEPYFSATRPAQQHTEDATELFTIFDFSQHETKTPTHTKLLSQNLVLATRSLLIRGAKRHQKHQAIKLRQQKPKNFHKVALAARNRRYHQPLPRHQHRRRMLHV